MVCRSLTYLTILGLMVQWMVLSIFLVSLGVQVLFFLWGLIELCFGGGVTHVQHSCIYEPENVGHARGV